MKRLFARSLLCFAALTRPVSAQEPPSLPDLAAKARPAIVIVETFDALGARLGTATGFFIADGRFITTRHAVENAAHVAAVLHDGLRLPVSRLLAEDEVGDLVLLEVEDLPREVPALSVTREPPRDGEDIFIIGVPLGIEHSITRGIVSGRLSRNVSVPMLQINASMSRGSSGSPVMNMDGAVVGIAAARIPEGEDFNLAIPAERIFHLDPNPMPFGDWARRQLERQKRREAEARNENAGIKPAFPLAISPEVRRAAASVVSLRVYDGNDVVLGEADGFFVSPDRVLTARRTLRDGVRVVVITAGGATLEVASVVGDDPVGGLALLEVRAEAQAITPALLEPRRPYRDEPLIVAPFGAREDGDFVQRRVTMTLTNVPGFGPVVSAGHIAAPGRAGSPVLSVAGTAIGVVVEHRDNDLPLRYIVRADRIQDHLFARPAAVGDWGRRAFAPPPPDRKDQPGATDRPLTLALPYMLTEQWDIAAQIVERGVTPDLADPERWLHIAICRSYLGDWPAVIDAANHALQIDSTSALACFLQGIGYAGQTGRDPLTALTLARDALRKAIDLDRTYSHHGYIRLAAILADLGDLEQGVQLMQQAVELWPDRPETHQMLASMYMHSSTQLTTSHEYGRGDRLRRLSLQEAFKAVELAPYAPWAYRQLAQCAALNEAAEPAIRAARQAVALAPDDPAALDTLGRIHLVFGDAAAAMSAYRSLTELDARAAEALLQAIQKKQNE